MPGDVLGDIDARILDVSRTVKSAGHLPACVARAVARDALDGRDHLVIVYAAILGPSHGAEFGAPISGFKRLDLFRAVIRPFVRLSSLACAVTSAQASNPVAAKSGMR